MGQSKITVRPDRVTGQLGDLYGIFFEDLNHAADGGLYAEMVQNRSFEFCAVDNPSYHPLMAWEKIEKKYSRMQWWIQDSHPYSRRNPHYLVCEIFETGMGAGVRNTGFTPGMYLQKGEKYRFSCLAATDGRGELPLRLVLENDEGRNLGQADIVVSNGTVWNHYEAEITAQETTTAGNLSIYIEAVGRLYLDMVSLFPQKTFMQQRNGLRADIATLLADLKPRFMRFPGGCLVHDGSINAEDRDSLYRWKNTIGVLEERPARRNNWGYNQTLGLGYYEYFCFCEEIGAKPLPVLPAGYDPHHQRKVPFDQLDEWIQEALDLISFANDDASAQWGRIRCELGHPEPFGLEYIGIGNEEVGEGFFERYPYFHKAIKEKYPDIQIIASSGPFAAGGEYEKGWNCARSNHADMVDEHYYMAPEWFLANHHRYDSFDENGPKVFLGEYASWGNTWYNALIEASYMTGMERNSEKVGLACYAPLLCNVNYINWKPDMIWFDNHQAYGTANYYVQKLFMNHQGNDRIELEMTGIDDSVTIQDDPKGGFGLRTEPDTVVRYSQIMIEDIQNGTIWKDSEVYFVGDNVEQYISADPDARVVTEDILLHTVESDHYIITVKGEMLYGRRGFMLQYGNRDEKNRYQWEIGGWQNMDSALTQDIAGRNSCLTQSSFTVAADREYELKLEIEGRHLRAYIDGELIHEIHHAPVKIEPLYTAASIDRQSGDVIVKLVNVQKRPIDTVLHMEGIELAKGTAYIMSGFALEDENSFAEPLKVSPREEEIQLTQGCCSCHIDGESVQVLRFQKS
ncbi:MAG: alpha-L-arabinofuranosidase C-terminal domain-containing protein [Lachnospiraceae bacterium]